MIENLIQICTKFEQINTVNFQLLIFRAKNLAGWVEGRVVGWMGGKAGLRIAYSNQKLTAIKNGFQYKNALRW